MLEKRRYSITRLKQEFHIQAAIQSLLEKRRYSITRLKLPIAFYTTNACLQDLKREDTRLRDWNTLKVKVVVFAVGLLKREDTRLRDWNELAVSATGVKADLKREDTRLRDWNVKRLRLCDLRRPLEKRRYSITRLKLAIFRAVCDWRLSWKEKILDYEIETKNGIFWSMPLFATWKEKILDYEIETIAIFLPEAKPLKILEKRRYSITRLKLGAFGQALAGRDRIGVKSWKEKHTRLRDWNLR